MTELYTFLDGAFADIRSKLDQEYQRRLTAHEARISEELSAEDYTPDYGKIDVVKALSHFHDEAVKKSIPRGYTMPVCKPQITSWVSGQQRTTLATDTHPDGRWIIHSIPIIKSRSYIDCGNTRTAYTVSIILIDNYGQSYSAQSTETTGNFHSATTFILDYKAAQPHKYTYKLPNCLIDYCKSLRDDPYDRTNNLDTVTYRPLDIKLNSLQLLAEHYYKRFTAMKPLFTSSRFTDYATLQAELEELRTKLAAEKAAHVATRDTLSRAKEEIVVLKAEIAEAKQKITTITQKLEATAEAAETTTIKLRDIVALVGGAVSDDPFITIRKKHTEQVFQLKRATETRESLTKEIERLRTENQQYVDQVFAQRQEITSYKKQLLETTESEPVVRPDLEALVTQMVAKALNPTLNIIEL